MNFEAWDHIGTVSEDRAGLDRLSGAVVAAWDPKRACLPCLVATDPDFAAAERSPPEVFTAMIAFELLGRRLGGGWDPFLEALAAARTEAGLVHFFLDRDRLPADTDCTAIGNRILLEQGRVTVEEARQVADRVLANVDERGIVATYFDPSGERSGIVDHVVCVNALGLVGAVGRLDEAEPTLAFVHRMLQSGRWLTGSRYYASADTFLFFLARVAAVHRDAFAPMIDLTRRALASRDGATDRPIERAQRVLAGRALGVPMPFDRATLQETATLAQPPNAFFRYGRSGRLFGSAALTSAFVSAVVAR